MNERNRDVDILYDRMSQAERTLERMDTTLTLLVDNLEKVITKVDRPVETKWGPIIAALSLVLALAGGYATMLVSPINARIEENHRLNDTQIEWHMKIERELGYLEGRHDALTQPNQ